MLIYPADPGGQQDKLRETDQVWTQNQVVIVYTEAIGAILLADHYNRSGP